MSQSIEKRQRRQFTPDEKGETLKVTTIRPKAPSSLVAARHMVAEFITYYSQERLHSAIGFVTPAD